MSSDNRSDSNEIEALTRRISDLEINNKLLSRQVAYLNGVINQSRASRSCSNQPKARNQRGEHAKRGATARAGEASDVERRKAQSSKSGRTRTDQFRGPLSPEELLYPRDRDDNIISLGDEVVILTRGRFSSRKGVVEAFAIERNRIVIRDTDKIPQERAPYNVRIVNRKA